MKGIQEVDPMDIPPKIGEETRKPELPRRMYSTFVASRLSWRDEGTGIGKGMIAVFLEAFDDLSRELKKELFGIDLL
jgi:hypothetical protein